MGTSIFTSCAMLSQAHIHSHTLPDLHHCQRDRRLGGLETYPAPDLESAEGVIETELGFVLRGLRRSYGLPWLIMVHEGTRRAQVPSKTHHACAPGLAKIAVSADSP